MRIDLEQEVGLLELVARDKSVKVDVYLLHEQVVGMLKDQPGDRVFLERFNAYLAEQGMPAVSVRGALNIYETAVGIIDGFKKKEQSADILSMTPR